MKAFLKYTVARLAILAVVYVVFWLLASRWWDIQPVDPFLLITAIVVSAVISLFVLRSLREEVAGRLEQRAKNATNRAETSRDADDLD